MQTAEKWGLASGWSHDIRTHLNILLGAVGMMDSGKLTAEQSKEYISIVQHNVTVVLRLVNHLLEADEGCVAGEARLANAQIDGSLVCLVESIKAYAAEHQLELLYDIEAPLYAYCDMEMLERVLYNLLSNAIKYTPPNGFVYLSARQRDGWVQINVADTGYGLSQQKQDQFRGDVMQPVGTGLGLRLVKMMTAAMKGYVECASRERIGTTFSVKIPVAVDQNAPYLHAMTGSQENTRFFSPS